MVAELSAGWRGVYGWLDSVKNNYFWLFYGGGVVWFLLIVSWSADRWTYKSQELKSRAESPDFVSNEVDREHEKYGNNVWPVLNVS